MGNNFSNKWAGWSPARIFRSFKKSNSSYLSRVEGWPPEEVQNFQAWFLFVEILRQLVHVVAKEGSEVAERVGHVEGDEVDPGLNALIYIASQVDSVVREIVKRPMDRPYVESLVDASPMSSVAPDLTATLLSLLRAMTISEPEINIDLTRMAVMAPQGDVTPDWRQIHRIVTEKLENLIGDDDGHGLPVANDSLIPVSIWLPTDRNATAVQEAINDLLASVELELVDAPPAEYGSWYRRLWFSAKKVGSSGELRERMQKIEHAF